MVRYYLFRVGITITTIYSVKFHKWGLRRIACVQILSQPHESGEVVSWRDIMLIWDFADASNNISLELNYAWCINKSPNHTPKPVKWAGLNQTSPISILDRSDRTPVLGLAGSWPTVPGWDTPTTTLGHHQTKPFQLSFTWLIKHYSLINFRNSLHATHMIEHLWSLKPRV